jgi:ATP/maltotriose-dependent transcriptional regulator MalT
MLSFIDFLAGAWDESIAGADDVLALSHRVGMRRGAATALCVRALVHTRRGQLTEALACLREARSVYGKAFASDRHVSGIGDVCEAMVLLERGDVRSALRAAQSLNASGLAVAGFCLSVLGAVQVATGDLAGARRTAAALAGHGPGAPYPAAASEWINGLAARAAGEVQAATASFGFAADGFAAVTMPYEAATSRLDWAELVAVGTEAEDGRARAAAQVTTELEVLERLGARPAADRARRLLRQFGLRPVTASRTRPAGELSARETEIARLVAEGLSNPEIAERLFISQRTVTTHLHRIYQRLGVGSRTSLTRYVVEHLSSTRRNT